MDQVSYSSFKRVSMNFARSVKMFGLSLPLTCRKKHRPVLKTYDQAPLYQRTNPYIRSGYRTRFTVSESLESLFYWTNETLNVWTHLLGLIACCYILANDFTRTVPGTSNQLVFDSTAELAMVLSLVVAFMCTMIFSMAYHTFSCISEDVYVECFRLDIIGIVICFTGIFINGINHGLGCHPTWRNIYFFLLGAASIYLLISLIIDRNLMDSSADKKRTILFCIWTALGMVPVGHCMYLEGYSSSLVQTFIFCVLTQYVIGFIAIFFYVSKFPECCMPGKVDYVGHSHQLWHLSVLAGCIWWHEVIVKLAIVRKDYICATY